MTSDMEFRQNAQACFAIAYHREGLVAGSDPLKECEKLTGWNRHTIIRAITEEFDREVRPNFPEDMANDRWLKLSSLWDSEALDKITDSDGNPKVVKHRRYEVRTQADVRTTLHGDTKDEAKGKLHKWRPKDEVDA